MKKQVTGYLKTPTQTIYYDTLAIWIEEEKILKMKEQDTLQTLFSLDLFNKKIIRENKKLKMILTFCENEDTIMNCKLKDLNQELSLAVKIQEQRETKNSFYLKYEILQEDNNSEQFTLELKY